MGADASDCVDASPPADEALRAHKRGLQRSDEVVQQLAVAKYARSVGDIPRTMAAVDAALGFARGSLSDLLALVNPMPAPQQRRYAGAMVRETPAGIRPARMQAQSRKRAPQP